MEKKLIYLDTNLLIGAIKEMLEKKDVTNVGVVKFLSENSNIESFISTLSVAEIVKVFRHDNEFKKYKLNFKRIISLIESLQNMMRFKLISNMKLTDEKGLPIGDSPNGIVITKDIIRYADIHHEHIDCMHVDLAKTNELTFVTQEDRLGKLKDEYENIMTFNKLSRNY